MARRHLSIPRLPSVAATPADHQGGDHWYNAALRRYRVSEDDTARSLFTFDEDRQIWGIDRVRQTARMLDTTSSYVSSPNLVTVVPVACQKGDVFNFAVMLSGAIAAKNIHDFTWIALYNSSDQLIGQTGNVVGWTMDAMRRFAFTAPVTIAEDGTHYAAIYNSGTGNPGDVATTPNAATMNAFTSLMAQYPTLAKQPSRTFPLARNTNAAPATIPATTIAAVRPYVALLPS